MNFETTKARIPRKIKKQYKKEYPNCIFTISRYIDSSDGIKYIINVKHK